MATSPIYTVKSATFSVDGMEFNVTGADLILELGSIPEAIVGIAPNALSKNRTDIHELSLSAMSQRLNYLVRKSEKLVPCNLSVSIESNNGEKDEIVLNNWVLKGVGLENVTTTSSFCMTCNISHPACRLCKDGGFFTNLAAIPDLAKLNPKDIIEAGAQAYEQLYLAARACPINVFDDKTGISPSGMSATAILEEVLGRLGDTPGNIRKYLKWDPRYSPAGHSLPLEGYLTPAQVDALKFLICTYWVFQDGGASHSVWETFMSLASSTGCVLIPDFGYRSSDKGSSECLPVAPRFPWGKPNASVEESDIYSILMPGVDPAPIFGICSTPGAAAGGQESLNTYQKQQGEMNELANMATSLVFIPTKADMHGEFITVANPPWLDSVLSLTAGFNNQLNTGSRMEEGDVKREDESTGQNDYMVARTKAIMAYLSGVFSAQYKASYQARVNCRFMPYAEGKRIVPGMVLAVKTSSGDTLFEGYVAHVAHSISMDAERAMTNILLSHCRPAGGYEVTNGYGGQSPIYI